MQTADERTASAEIAKEELSVCDRLLAKASGWAGRHKAPLISAFAAGLLAHGFALANKLLNADEIAALFGKGADFESGRWALPLTSLLFPDISMPWIYGILSIVLIAIAACLAVDAFEIRSHALQAAFAGIAVTFPAVTGLLCYMFTSAPYALAFLMSVTAVYLVCRGGRYRWIWSGLLLVLSLGIYQAYLTAAASFFIVLMIKRLLKEESTAGEVLRFGLKALALMLASLAVYYIIVLISLRVTGAQLLGYGMDNEYGLLHRFLLNYSSFVRTVTRGFFGYVPTAFDSALHIVCAAVTLGLLCVWLVRVKDAGKRWLMLLCLAAYPPSIFCMYLVADIGILHSLVFYGFISVYLLAAVVTEGGWSRREKLLRDVLLVSMSLSVLCNVYAANKTYLRTYLQYENAYSFYTGVVTQVKQTEGFDENTRLALIGRADNKVYLPQELDTGSLAGPSDSLLNVYTREDFVLRYIGFDVEFATEAEKQRISEDARFEAMPEYPYYGSVREIDGCIVVKFG